LLRVGPDWGRRYRALAKRLRAALGDAFDGGVLLDLAHVGSTAVPGLPAKPTLDVMARVHPWPPRVDAEAALLALGFVAHGEHGLPGRAYYTLGRHEVHLHVVGVESDHWDRHLALRDLLRADPRARARYAVEKRGALAAASTASDPRRARAAYREGKAATVAALEREAQAWRVARVGFEPVRRVAAWLAAAPARWAVAGGWALDAGLGTPTRAHGDVDVVVDRRFAGGVLDALAAGGAEVAWVVPGADGVGAYRRRHPGEPPPGGGHQAHARHGARWIDVLLEPWDDDAWRYRRSPDITLSLARAVSHRAVEGSTIPVMAPEAVLLFKATTSGRARPRPKDDADLERALPRLSHEARAWLGAALVATAPGHPWVERLAPPSR